jgi:preprotein translocase subunit YajC
MSLFSSTSTPANAPANSPHEGGSLLSMLPMLILFVLVFYFLLVRPQTKRAKEQRKLLSSVAVGDEVMTAGGIVGKVVQLKDNYVILAIAKGVEVTMQKGSVASVLPKGTMSSIE